MQQFGRVMMLASFARLLHAFRHELRSECSRELLGAIRTSENAERKDEPTFEQCLAGGPQLEAIFPNPNTDVEVKPCWVQGIQTSLPGSGERHCRYLPVTMYTIESRTHPGRVLECGGPMPPPAAVEDTDLPVDGDGDEDQFDDSIFDESIARDALKGVFDTAVSSVTSSSEEKSHGAKSPWSSRNVAKLGKRSSSFAAYNIQRMDPRTFNSMSKTVNQLKRHPELVPGGLAGVYSNKKRRWYLVWRSDKAREAAAVLDRIARVTAY